jgi:hypothetical protein
MPRSLQIHLFFCFAFWMAYSKVNLENSGHNNNKIKRTWPKEMVLRADVKIPSGEISNLTRSHQYAVFLKIPSKYMSNRVRDGINTNKISRLQACILIYYYQVTVFIQQYL